MKKNKQRCYLRCRTFHLTLRPSGYYELVTKDMFQEYVDFSVNEAMQQRNKKQIRSMKHSYQEIQMLQSDLHHKLISHLDRCVNHCNSLLEKRKDRKFLVDIKTIDSLLGRLDLKEQEIFMAAKNILVSIADLRKTEIKTIERDIFKVKKKDLFKGSLENKLSEFLSSFIVFTSKGFEERNNLQNLLEDGMNLLNDAKNNVSARIMILLQQSPKQNEAWTQLAHALRHLWFQEMWCPHPVETVHRDRNSGLLI
ncbi:UNVERIFIED_CONTAM: hypothetical protein NCL1_17825 [Trichonephila clavipes]